MAETWGTQDRLDREVILTTTSLAHIVGRHEDMVDWLDEVPRAIERPELVTRDKDYRHRENHYRRLPADEGWIRVVVHYRPVPPQGRWAGEVITAHRLGRPDPREEPLSS